MGAPPGDVGDEEGGQLTEAVRRRPSCVILLDEGEKAHPEVFDIRCRCSTTTPHRWPGPYGGLPQPILILTSSLGSQFIADPALDETAKRDAVMSVVRSTFEPEFLNRLDDVILFEALTTEELDEMSSCRWRCWAGA